MTKCEPNNMTFDTVLGLKVFEDIERNNNAVAPVNDSGSHAKLEAMLRSCSALESYNI